MKCECCNHNEATIHLTQVVNGVVKKVHICEECAKKNGWDLSSPISITDILLGLGKLQEKHSVVSDLDISCPACHMRRSDFEKNGRLGCPVCYETFVGEVASLVNAMHHGSQHVGKIPARAGRGARREAEIATLKKRMDEAILQENFEAAAELRDQIRRLQEEGDE